ncbi:MAG: hypothetical protein IKT94_04160 [Rikenellaceae bacterium]|nr:hypothetical protein [Rikenellaceae bacterium]
MKRIFNIFALLLLTVTVAEAQDIEKEVVVTKEYTPTLETPDKLPITPRMEDTVTLRPEVRYSITPTGWATNFEQRPIAAANTYVWNYHRQPLFYAKVGAGYPLNSTADLLLSHTDGARNSFGVDVKHRGQWCDVKDQSGVKKNADYSESSLMLFGTLGVGERMQAGAEIVADHDWRYYYGDVNPQVSAMSLPLVGLSAENPFNGFGAGGRVWIGDDFSDLSRFNFRVAVDGGYYYSKVKNLFIKQLGEGEVSDFEAGLAHVGAKAELAKMFSQHGARLIAEYRYKSGTKQSGYRNSILSVAPHYMFNNGALCIEAGVKVEIDNCTSNAAVNDALGHYALGYSFYSGEKSKGVHLFPYLRLVYNEGGVFAPFVEADGGLQSYDQQSLAQLNPYIAPVYDAPNADLYTVRLGLMGATRSNSLTYSVWAGASINNRALYPFMMGAYYFPLIDKLVRIDFGGEVVMRPVRGLEVALDARYHINKIGSKIDKFVGISSESVDGVEQPSLYQNLVDYKGGRSPLPAFDVDLKVRYTASKFMVGAKFGVTDAYDCLQMVSLSGAEYLGYFYESECPMRLDLGVEAEYKVGKHLSIWVEGNNLLNRRYCTYPLYLSVGVNCTAGVKLIF